MLFRSRCGAAAAGCSVTACAGADVVRVIRSRSIFLRNGLGRFSSSERSYSTGGKSWGTVLPGRLELATEGGREGGRDLGFDRACEGTEDDVAVAEGMCIALSMRPFGRELESERMDGLRRRVGALWWACFGVLSTSSVSVSLSTSTG